MNNIEDAVYKTIVKYNMIKSGDKILVGLSGGPDSVFLLTVIKKLKDKLNIELGAAHLNHCIRGKEADRDENFSEKLCADLKIDYYSKKVDIPLISKAKKYRKRVPADRKDTHFLMSFAKNTDLIKQPLHII